ncbi:MAG: hypothetical protein AAGH41_14590, partial [Pseudomonadota bacterium]
YGHATKKPDKFRVVGFVVTLFLGVGGSVTDRAATIKKVRRSERCRSSEPVFSSACRATSGPPDASSSSYVFSISSGKDASFSKALDHLN